MGRTHSQLGCWFAALALGVFATQALAQSSFVTFESGQVRPLALSPDGTRLYAVNTPDNNLEIFSVGTSGLTKLSSISVGMEPVSVAVRSATEVAGSFPMRQVPIRWPTPKTPESKRSVAPRASRIRLLKRRAASSPAPSATRQPPELEELRAEVRLPSRLAAGQKVPLLLILHSLGTSAEDIAGKTDWPSFAEQQGVAANHGRMVPGCWLGIG